MVEALAILCALIGFPALMLAMTLVMMYVGAPTSYKETMREMLQLACTDTLRKLKRKRRVKVPRVKVLKE